LPFSNDKLLSFFSKALHLFFLERCVVYDHATKHAINKIIHQTSLKYYNKLLKLACLLR
jgi:hypothetical protein